jgi:2'-5' RNA ligase
MSLITERSTAGLNKYCLYTRLFPQEPFIDLLKNIDDNDLHEFGKEKEPHVTVLYGINDSSAYETIRSDCEKNNVDPIKIKLSKISVFDNPEFDVLKFDVESADIHKLNKKVCSLVEYENDFPDYHPHCTIAYLKKGLGKKYVDSLKFDVDKVYNCDTLVFSYPDDGKKVKFKLTGMSEYRKFVRSLI